MHKINLPRLLLFFYESVETTQQNTIRRAKNVNRKFNMLHIK